MIQKAIVSAAILENDLHALSMEMRFSPNFCANESHGALPQMLPEHSELAGAFCLRPYVHGFFQKLF